MSAEPPIPGSTPSASRRRAVRTTTVLGLFGLFVVAVLFVLLRRAFPDRISNALERTLRKHR